MYREINIVIGCVSLALAWWAGMFFGMGLQKLLFQRKNCGDKCGNCKNGVCNPLPVSQKEGND